MSTNNTPSMPQIHAQTALNSNNKATHHTYTIEFLGYPVYFISPMECNHINIWLGRTLNDSNSSIIIEINDVEVKK